MCIDGPSAAVHSENILEDLYYSKDGRVIVYTDEYINKNSDCFSYYYKVWDHLPKTISMESLRSSEAISSKDIVILHTNLEDELLEKAFNRLIEMDFHSPNIVILFESPSHYTEPVQELEDMILKYTSESCLSSTTIRVFYTDGMETNYYYYVE